MTRYTAESCPSLGVNKGPLVPPTSGLCWALPGQLLLIVVDSYTKWLEVMRVPSTSLQAVIKALHPIFTTHGLPDTVGTDNGTAFTASEFQEFLQGNLIRHIQSATFHPSTNGQAEWMVRTAKDSLQWLMQGDWERRLAEFLLAYRTMTLHSASRHCPAELLIGQRLTTHLNCLHLDRAPDQHKPVEVQEAPRKFFLGDPVCARNYTSSPEWRPAKILRVTGPKSYEVSTEDVQMLQKDINQLRSHLPMDPRKGQETATDIDPLEVQLPSALDGVAKAVEYLRASEP